MQIDSIVLQCRCRFATMSNVSQPYQIVNGARRAAMTDVARIRSDQRRVVADSTVLNRVSAFLGRTLQYCSMLLLSRSSYPLDPTIFVSLRQ